MSRVSPWIPITDATDLKHLGKLLEELAECSDAALRLSMMGRGAPFFKLEEELADVVANITLVERRFGLRVSKFVELWRAEDAHDKMLEALAVHCNKASQVTARCLIQGLDAYKPKTDLLNRFWLEDTLRGVFVAVRAIIGYYNLDQSRIDARVIFKMGKLEVWHAMGAGR